MKSEYVNTLRNIVRTRPILSPSQPKAKPPHAAPTRKQAMIMLITETICSSLVTFKRSCSAGRATRGNSPISTPSNIQPVKAATSANHWPLVNVFPSAMMLSEYRPASRGASSPPGMTELRQYRQSDAGWQPTAPRVGVVSSDGRL